MRRINLIEDDIKALKKSIPSIEEDLEIRFTADKNKFAEFGVIDGFLQNVQGYTVHKHRLVTLNPQLVGKRGPRLWVLVHKEKEVYIQCLLYPVGEEPQFPSKVCYKTILTRLSQWETEQN